MGNQPGRRGRARLPVPARLSGSGPEARQVHLCDLSPDGARLLHDRPLPDWNICFLDLPHILGGARLRGQLIWSQAGGRKRLADGTRLVHYHSGLAFRRLTVEQRARLRAALQLLAAAQQSADPPPPREARWASADADR